MLLRTLGATLIVALVATASAQLPPLPELQRVLLPITVTNSSGAFGSTWTSELRYFIDPGTPFLIFPLRSAGCEPACNEPIPPITGIVFHAGFFATEPTETGGAWLYVQKSAADHVHITLTLRENSHLVTQIPAVPESEFFEGPANIVGAPYNPNTRLTLRVYANEDFAGSAVGCRILDELTKEVLFDQVVPLSVTQRYFMTTYTFALRPAYGQLSWQPTTTTSTGRVRVEITPLTPGLRYWAFISATDNTTQQTVILTTR